MKSLHTLFAILTLFLTFSFSQKVREEITEIYNDGNKKLLVKYKDEGSNEVVVEKISYNENGDTLMLVKPLEKLKMLRNYQM